MTQKEAGKISEIKTIFQQFILYKRPKESYNE